MVQEPPFPPAPEMMAKIPAISAGILNSYSYLKSCSINRIALYILIRKILLSSLCLCLCACIFSCSSEIDQEVSVDSRKGGSSYRGDVLLHETFKDTDFASRGWYEVADHAISNSDNSAHGTAQVLKGRVPVGDEV